LIHSIFIFAFEEVNFLSKKEVTDLPFFREGFTGVIRGCVGHYA